MVHQLEHVLEPLVRLANEVALAFAPLAEIESCRWLSLQPHLVFDACCGNVVKFSNGTIIIHSIFGHDEQADSFDARRSVCYTRQNRMNDIFSDILITGGDKPLYPFNGVASIRSQRRCCCLDVAKRCARIRFRKRHGATPLAAVQFRHKLVHQFLGGAVLNKTTGTARAKHHHRSRGVAAVEQE